MFYSWPLNRITGGEWPLSCNFNRELDFLCFRKVIRCKITVILVVKVKHRLVIENLPMEKLFKSLLKGSNAENDLHS